MTQAFIDILNTVNPLIMDYQDADLHAEGIIDSMDVMRIISALEEAYGVEFDVDDVTAENFSSAKNIWNMLETLKARE